MILTRALGEHKHMPNPKFQPKVIMDSNPHFRLIQIQMSIRSVPNCCGCIILSASVTSPSTIQTGRLLYGMRNANKINAQKSPVPQRLSFQTVIPNPLADPDHQQMLISFRGSLLTDVCQVWSTSVSAFVSYTVYRMTRRNDR